MNEAKSDKIIYRKYSKKELIFWYENNNKNDVKVLNTYCSTDYVMCGFTAVIINGHWKTYL